MTNPFDKDREYFKTTSSDAPPASKGLKLDTDKPQWDLLPWGPVSQVVDVLTYGAKKYQPYNWLVVKQPRDRYFAAAMRHVTAWFLGEKIDPESGLPHLAHTVCCILFLLHFDKDKS
jgi:hypothetical protein